MYTQLSCLVYDIQIGATFGLLPSPRGIGDTGYLGYVD